ncbi:translation elongation factor Ts [candidate division KSB1 bacterium]
MAISAADVKKLRDSTGAGMMDCKKALADANGDFDAAVDELRKRGMAVARKKEGRQANDGLINAYIHTGGKLGVLIEVNCETDFVARTPEYQEFVRDLAMQVAAANPLVVTSEDLPSETVESEKKIYREQALEQGKPEKILDRIVEGRLKKYYQEVCLLEQPFIKEPEKTISDLLSEKIAQFGENILIRRFTRFVLGG